VSNFRLINGANFKVEGDSRILKADEYATVSEAKRLITQAEEEAQKIIASAEAAYKDEKARGYQDGCMEGKAVQSEKMMTATIEAVNYFSEVENKVVDIVMAATRKILSNFDDLELTKGIVEQALDKVRNESKITLRVCPQHADAIRAQINEITTNYRNISFIDVVADARLEEAACKVETEMGSVDTSVDLQLQALHNALLKNFDSDSESETSE